MNTHLFFHSGAVIPVALALIFAFSNGFRDSSTIVATVVSTRALTPSVAFLLCALFEFIGALLVGSAVAYTIGGKLLGKGVMAARGEVWLVLAAGLAAAISWGAISWWRAWPTSNSHALVAGLSGAGLSLWGIGQLHNKVILIILGVLVLSPMLGLLISSGVTALFQFLGEWFTPRVKPLAEALHVLACLIISTAHGSNDGQMTMGVLLLALGFIGLGHPGGSNEPTLIPIGVRLAVAIAMSSGVLLGGRRILKKLGMKFYRIRQLQGLGAGVTSASMILTCALGGFPASTTQVIAGSIIGAGVAKNPRAVRWYTASDIVLSWLLTLPIVGVLAFGFCRLFSVLLG